MIDFHNKFGHPVRESPQLVSDEETELAFSFILEEFKELGAALDSNCCTHCEYACEKLIEVADALGDIVVTCYGMALRHGIDLDAVLEEIQRSNMTKTANGQGKIKKGPDFSPADLGPVLFPKDS